MLPTPVHPWRLPGLPPNVQVWIKRDDLTGMQLSGNKVRLPSAAVQRPGTGRPPLRKPQGRNNDAPTPTHAPIPTARPVPARPQVRKLEFLLADAKRQGADCVVTIGGIQSNHCRATAVAARYLGLEAHLLLRTSRQAVGADPGLEGNLLVDRMVGAHIHLVRAEGRLVAWGGRGRRRRGRRPAALGQGRRAATPRPRGRPGGAWDGAIRGGAAVGAGASWGAGGVRQCARALARGCLTCRAARQKRPFRREDGSEGQQPAN